MRAIIQEYIKNHQDLPCIAIVEHSINWVEKCQSIPEAVKLLRELVEADKRYIFMHVNGWDRVRKVKLPTEEQEIFTTITWCDTQTGKTYNKTIKLDNIRVKDII